MIINFITTTINSRSNKHVTKKVNPRVSWFGGRVKIEMDRVIQSSPDLNNRNKKYTSLILSINLETHVLIYYLLNHRPESLY